jgi:hypothetical protein
VNDHPVMVNVPIRDFFIDPTATGLDNARYMGRRYLTTIDELKSYEIIDINNPEETPVMDDAVIRLTRPKSLSDDCQV